MAPPPLQTHVTRSSPQKPDDCGSHPVGQAGGMQTPPLHSFWHCHVPASVHTHPVGMHTVMAGCAQTSPEAQSSFVAQPLGSGVVHEGVSTHTPPPQSRVHAHSPFMQSQRDGTQRPLSAWHD
jgi:hypothetical protein